MDGETGKRGSIVDNIYLCIYQCISLSLFFSHSLPSSSSPSFASGGSTFAVRWAPLFSYSVEVPANFLVFRFDKTCFVSPLSAFHFPPLLSFPFLFFWFLIFSFLPSYSASLVRFSLFSFLLIPSHSLLISSYSVSLVRFFPIFFIPSHSL